jgi:hypothetical protein
MGQGAEWGMARKANERQPRERQGRALPGPPAGVPPAWREAKPQFIARALARATALPSGGWYVLGDSRALAQRPQGFQVDGRELVAWRTPAGELRVGPATCPHLGGDLSGGHVDADGCVVCPWHGLALGGRSHASWQVLPAFDDGVLCWVRLDGDPATERPVLTGRPDLFVASVIRLDARCDPEDVIANRLDPWHGTHLHPHSFGRLRVLSAETDEIQVEVTYLVAGRVPVTVEASFTSPEPRTIVMTITGGEGRGSVVETHATPVAPGHTVVTEATLVTSERPGFRFAPRFAPAIRWAANVAARRLWEDDRVYAERRYELRRRRAADARSEEEATREANAGRASRPRGGTDHSGT